MFVLLRIFAFLVYKLPKEWNDSIIGAKLVVVHGERGKTEDNAKVKGPPIALWGLKQAARCPLISGLRPFCFSARVRVS